MDTVATDRAAAPSAAPTRNFFMDDLRICLSLNEIAALRKDSTGRTSDVGSAKWFSRVYQRARIFRRRWLGATKHVWRETAKGYRAKVVDNDDLQPNLIRPSGRQQEYIMRR